MTSSLYVVCVTGMPWKVALVNLLVNCYLLANFYFKAYHL